MEKAHRKRGRVCVKCRTSPYERACQFDALGERLRLIFSVCACVVFSSFASLVRPCACKVLAGVGGGISKLRPPANLVSNARVPTDPALAKALQDSHGFAKQRRQEVAAQLNQSSRSDTTGFHVEHAAGPKPWGARKQATLQKNIHDHEIP